MAELVHKLDWHVEQTRKAWDKQGDAALETGRCIAAAMSELDHGDKQKYSEEIGIAPRTARALSQLADAYDFEGNDEGPPGRFRHHDAVLPRDWNARLLLLALSDEEWRSALKDGKIRPEMTRADAKALKQKVIKLEGGSKKEVELKIEEIKESLTPNQLKNFNEKFDHAVSLMAHQLLIEQIDAAFSEQRKILSKREDELKEEWVLLSARRKDITGYMTEKEFNLVRGCLHPDRAGDDQVLHKRLDQAFQIFNRLMVYVPTLNKQELEVRGWKNVKR